MKTEATRLVAAPENRTIRNNRFRALLSPIILMELYLAFTVFVFLFGPVDWHVPNAAKLIIYVLFNYGGLWVGYVWGIRKGKIALKQSKIDEVGIVRIPQQVMWLILWSMLFNIFSCLVRVYVIRGDLGVVASTFLNPGEAYQQSQVIAQMDRDSKMISDIAKYSWAFRISTLLSVLNSLYFPLALICWRRMNRVFRIVFYISFFCTIVFSVGLGAQSGATFLLFSALPVALYRIYVTGKPITGGQTNHIPVKSRKRSTPARIKLIIAASLCVVVAMIVFFQLDRAEVTGAEFTAENTLAGSFSSPSERGIIKLTGGKVNFGIVQMCNYISHSYEGLALAMELPFEWTYGLGWSKALQVMYHKYLSGPDLFEKTYLARNEAKTGWSALSWWSTIFPWIASDTTYYGTILIMILIGFVIGRCWVGVIITGNPIGFAVLAQMFTLVFMFPANNAVAQTLEGFFSLIGVFSIYIISWKYFKPIRAAAVTGHE